MSPRYMDAKSRRKPGSTSSPDIVSETYLSVMFDVNISKRAPMSIFAPTTARRPMVRVQRIDGLYWGRRVLSAEGRADTRAA